MFQYCHFDDSGKKNRQPVLLGVATAISLTFNFLMIGCASTIKSDNFPENDEHTSIFIAQPCETVEAGSADAKQKVDGVFIEAAWNIQSVIPDPVGNWLNDNPVVANAYGGAKIENDLSYIFNVINSEDPAKVYSLVVTPTFTEDVDGDISISVKATKGNSQEIVLDEKTVVTRHQKPIVLRLDTESNAITKYPIVITPYLLSGDSSMQKLLICKMSNSASKEKR